jgi:hypothetical protein
VDGEAESPEGAAAQQGVGASAWQACTPLGVPSTHIPKSAPSCTSLPHLLDYLVHIDKQDNCTCG